MDVNRIYEVVIFLKNESEPCEYTVYTLDTALNRFRDCVEQNCVRECRVYYSDSYNRSYIMLNYIAPLYN